MNKPLDILLGDSSSIVPGTPSIKAEDIEKFYRIFPAMPKTETLTVNVDIVVNEKALRALRVLLELCDDLAEDFAYRDDVKRGLRAAKYLMKNVRLDARSGVHLFE